MIYCFICKDGPKADNLRKEHLAAHLSHVEEVIDTIKVAGPVPRDTDGYRGSILMLEAETEDEAWALFNTDPYAKAEIWDSVEILPFNAVAGQWLGGVTWK